VFKGSWRGFSGTVAAAAVGGWLFRRMSFVAIASSWRHLEPVWLLLSFVSCAAMLAVRSAKWRWLLADTGHDRGAAQAVRSLFGSYTLGTLTPGRLGDLARCAFVPEYSRKKVLEITLIDRAFDLFAVLTFAAASCVFLFSKLTGAITLCLWLSACIWVSRAGLPLLSKPSWLPRRLREHWLDFASALLAIRHGHYAAWALAASLCDLATLSFLLRAFHQHSLLAAFVAFPWLTLASGSPVSLGGLGPREGISAWIFSSFSIPAATALNISLLFFGLTLLLPSVAGGVWLAAGSAASWLTTARLKVKTLRRGWGHQFFPYRLK
jgi:uncharacterized membrane protein YbhN (UPF0104 family)